MNVTSNARAMFRLGQPCTRMKTVLSANSESVTTVECLYEGMDLPMRMSRYASAHSVP